MTSSSPPEIAFLGQCPGHIAIISPCSRSWFWTCRTDVSELFPGKLLVGSSRGHSPVDRAESEEFAFSELDLKLFCPTPQA